MDVMLTRCAGLDVHKKTIVACVLIHTATESRQVIQTFGTTTGALRALADWLTDLQVTHVAMESTGSYWKPVFTVLEALFTTWLVNPAHIKAVPGRKTDVKDSAWIAQLLQHGLLQPSFIPDRAQRELRELTRYRKSLIRRAGARGQPHSEGLGRREHQARLGHQRCARGLGDAHSPGFGAGGNGSRSVGHPGG